MPANPASTARFAGLLYLVIIVAGIWSEGFVRSAMTVPGDAAATAANILANEAMFRMSFAADVVMALSDAGLAVLLYVLLKPVSHTLALAAMVFRLIQTAVLASNLMNQDAALMLLNGAASMTGFDTAQLQSLALLRLEVQSHGYDLGLVFFGINSLLVAALLIRARFTPSLIGYLMLAAGLVYLTGSSLVFLAPALVEDFAMAYAVPVLAEATFALWLIVRGVKADAWREAAARSLPA